MALRRGRSNEGKRQAAREAVKQLAPEHREAIEASGYGPGDGYIGIWDQIALLVTDQRDTMTNLTRSHPKAAALAAMKQRLDYLSERIIAAFIAVIPYERPRLAVMQFKGELTDAPIIDLSKLSDARLQQLKEITLLLAGATGGTDHANDDPPGGVAPPKGEGARKGPPGLRKALRAART